MPLQRSSFTPAGTGFPLGEWIAADHVAGDARHEIWCWDGEGHRLIVGPSGSGKFQAAIAPLILTADATSLIVFDVANGEATRAAAGWRARHGPVMILDPFSITNARAGSLNPLDLLRLNDPTLLSKARRLTDALMMLAKTGGDSDYWNGQAANFLTALLIHVASSPDEAGTRTLKRVREIIRRPFAPSPDFDWAAPSFENWANGAVLFAMRNSLIADGVVRDEAENILSAEGGRNAFYIQQTLRENTSFLDLPEVQRVTATTSFDVRQLRARISTLFIVAPEYELRNVGRWLRLVYAVVMEEMRAAVMGAAAGRSVPLHVVLDEFPAFGRFDRVRDDMALVRKFGINFHIAVQKLSQMKALYGDGWEGFVPTVMQVLGADELTTAEYVSKRLGNETRATQSHTRSQAQPGGSRSTTDATFSAPLRAAHEIEQMDPGRCLVLVAAQGQKPLDLRKWNLFASDYLLGRSAVATTV